MCPGKRGKRLYDQAVSSIFPNFPAHLQKPGTKQKSPTKRKCNSPIKRKSEPSFSSASPSKVAKDHPYVKNIDLSEQLNTYKKKVKSLNEKVH